jgi:hypothetical protein
MVMPTIAQQKAWGDGFSPKLHVHGTLQVHASLSVPAMCQGVAALARYASDAKQAATAAAVPNTFVVLMGSSRIETVFALFP